MPSSRKRKPAVAPQPKGRGDPARRKGHAAAGAPQAKASTRKAAGTSAYNAPLGDDERAAIWARYDQEVSIRQIARELNRSESTVCGVLHDDPKRLNELRAKFRALRAERFASLESRTYEVAHQMMDRMMDISADEKTFTKAFQSMNVAAGAKALQAVGGLGLGAAKAYELLTGNPTERTATAVSAASEAEALIERAVAAGQACINDLPVAYRAKAQAIFDERTRSAT